jgi:hypothetical protein
VHDSDANWKRWPPKFTLTTKLGEKIEEFILGDEEIVLLAVLKRNGSGRRNVKARNGARKR